jgi:hypothetical protein
VNWKLYEDGYLIPNYPSTFICNSCALSKSKHKVPILAEPKSIAEFELIHTDICRLFLNESYLSLQYVLTIINDFCCFSSVFVLKQKSDTSITLHILFNYVERQFGKKIKRIPSDNGVKYISVMN